MKHDVCVVTSEAELEGLIRHLDEAGAGCFDFEFIPERTYFPVLCLVQICVETTAYIVDPFELPDLSELWARVADPDILCIFHAGGQDLEIAYQQSGLVPKNIFDTQISAGFAGLGYSAGYRRLLEQVLNVRIEKTESYSDWQARPLTREQIDYAVNDVIHLMPLYEDIVSRLEEMGRLDWALEECRAYEDESTYNRDKERDFMRIKGASSLSPRALAVLREVWWWRDEEARRENKPPRVILSDNALFEVAKRKISTLDGLKKMRGMRGDQVRNYGDYILEAIARAKALSEEECPVWPSGRAPHKSELLVGDFLYLMLKCRASEIGLAPEHLTTRDELQNLLKQHKAGKLDEESDFKLLKGWRFENAGKLILELIEGDSVKVSIGMDGRKTMHLDIAM